MHLTRDSVSYKFHRQVCITQEAMHLTDNSVSYKFHRQLCFIQGAMHLTDNFVSYKFYGQLRNGFASYRQLCIRQMHVALHHTDSFAWHRQSNFHAQGMARGRGRRAGRIMPRNQSYVTLLAEPVIIIAPASGWIMDQLVEMTYTSRLSQHHVAVHEWPASWRYEQSSRH